MLLLTSILLVSFGVISSATEDDSCKERRPSHCFGDDVPLDFPNSEEALDKICPIILPRIKCVVDSKKKCPDMVLPYFLGENLDGVYAVFEEACDKDSELNRGLATHLPCIEKSIMGHVATCEPMVHKALEEMTSHLNLDFEAEDVFPNEEVRAKFVCTKEALETTCYLASTSVKCGEEALELSRSIIERFGVIDMLCPEDIREEVKAAAALVQPLMELGFAGEEVVSKIK